MSVKEEITIAGAGGQGVLVMGKLISYASFQKGLQVAFVQQYAPYVRGGGSRATWRSQMRRWSLR